MKWLKPLKTQYYRLGKNPQTFGHYFLKFLFLKILKSLTLAIYLYRKTKKIPYLESKLVISSRSYFLFDGQGKRPSLIMVNSPVRLSNNKLNFSGSTAPSVGYQRCILFNFVFGLPYRLRPIRLETRLYHQRIQSFILNRKNLVQIDIQQWSRIPLAKEEKSPVLIRQFKFTPTYHLFRYSFHILGVCVTEDWNVYCLIIIQKHFNMQRNH